MSPRRLTWALAALLPLAAVAAPPTHLHKGEWAYHATMTFTSGPLAGRSMSRDWKTCVSKDDVAPRLLPRHPGAQTQCTAAALTQAGDSFHSHITCVAQIRGMTNRADEDFHFTPAADGNAVDLDGHVHQSLSGAPVKIPPSDISVKVHGTRTGRCSG